MNEFDKQMLGLSKDFDKGAGIVPGGGISNAPSKAEQQQALQNEKAATFNEANQGGIAATPARRKRIPLSVPRRKLEVDPIPGFVLYWFKESNIGIAIDAGYDFVDNREVKLVQSTESNSSDQSGNTDLGSRVSVIGDKIGERGVPERLVLMKIPEEWWREDRELLDNQNAEIIKSIFGQGVIAGQSQGDHSQSYVKTNIAQGSGKLLNRGLKKVT